MGFEQFVFYVFAAVMLFAGAMVILARNPVHAALFLVLTFVSAAGLWMLLEAEFLAITLVLVYVGAVMVLFLFVVMMLDINMVPLREGFMRHLPVGILVALVMITLMVIVVMKTDFQGTTEAISHGPDYNNTAELGSILYTVYVYPFELAAVVLVVAIVAAIALTLRRRPMVKHQNPDAQIAIRKQDRLKVLKMEAEPNRLNRAGKNSNDGAGE